MNEKEMTIDLKELQVTKEDLKNKNDFIIINDSCKGFYQVEYDSILEEAILEKYKSYKDKSCTEDTLVNHTDVYGILQFKWIENKLDEIWEIFLKIKPIKYSFLILSFAYEFYSLYKIEKCPNDCYQILIPKDKEEENEEEIITNKKEAEKEEIFTPEGIDNEFYGLIENSNNNKLFKEKLEKLKRKIYYEKPEIEKDKVSKKPTANKKNETNISNSATRLDSPENNHQAEEAKKLEIKLSYESETINIEEIEDIFYKYYIYFSTVIGNNNDLIKYIIKEYNPEKKIINKNLRVAVLTCIQKHFNEKRNPMLNALEEKEIFESIYDYFYSYHSFNEEEVPEELYLSFLHFENSSNDLISHYFMNYFFKSEEDPVNKIDTIYLTYCPKSEFRIFFGLIHSLRLLFEKENRKKTVFNLLNFIKPHVFKYKRSTSIDNLYLSKKEKPSLKRAKSLSITSRHKLGLKQFKSANELVVAKKFCEKLKKKVVKTIQDKIVDLIKELLKEKCDEIKKPLIEQLRNALIEGYENDLEKEKDTPMDETLMQKINDIFYA